MQKNRPAFTFAEVLIAIVVIGVIASSTIPIMIKTTQKRETVAAVQKAYETLQNSIYMAQAKHGDMNGWDIPAEGGLERAAALSDYLKPHLSILKVCGSGTGCFANTTYKYLNGSSWSNLDTRTDLYKFVLSDGMAVAIKNYPESSVNSQGFFVDINGAKGPNVRGIDEFVFVLNASKNHIFPYGKDVEASEVNNDCSVSGEGNYCSTYILVHSNMDYLK